MIPRPDSSSFRTGREHQDAHQPERQGDTRWPSPGSGTPAIPPPVAGYEETPLVDAPKLAGALGVGKVFVKDESSRLGLPAFKVLGASWAVYRALEDRLGQDFGDWEEIGELEEQTRTLAAALARRGHRRQPRARRGTGGAATGSRGEDLRSSGHG